jgi:hypothetical protein
MIRCLLLGIALIVTGGIHAAEAPPFEATFLGNDQEAALHHVLVQTGDPWQDEPTYVVIVAEKDPAAAEMPDHAVMFGELGHALMFTVTEGGELIGVQICHQDLERTNISSIGTTEIHDFRIADGHLHARFVTPEEQDFFGDRWRFEVTVRAPLPSD